MNKQSKEEWTQNNARFQCKQDRTNHVSWSCGLMLTRALMPIQPSGVALLSAAAMGSVIPWELTETNWLHNQATEATEKLRVWLRSLISFDSVRCAKIIWCKYMQMMYCRVWLLTPFESTVLVSLLVTKRRKSCGRSPFASPQMLLVASAIPWRLIDAYHHHKW